MQQRMRDIRVPVPVELARELKLLAARSGVSRVALVRACMAAIVDRVELATGPGATQAEAGLAQRLAFRFNGEELASFRQLLDALAELRELESKGEPLAGRKAAKHARALGEVHARIDAIRDDLGVGQEGMK